MAICITLAPAALLAASALALAACAGPVSEPQASAAPAVMRQVQAIKLDPPKPKPHRMDVSCHAARVLPAERKAALFRQFDAEHGGVEQAGVEQAGAESPAPEAPPPAQRSDPCRQAAR